MVTPNEEVDRVVVVYEIEEPDFDDIGNNSVS